MRGAPRGRLWLCCRFGQGFLLPSTALTAAVPLPIIRYFCICMSVLSIRSFRCVGQRVCPWQRVYLSAVESDWLWRRAGQKPRLIIPKPTSKSKTKAAKPQNLKIHRRKAITYRTVRYASQAFHRKVKRWHHQRSESQRAKRATSLFAHLSSKTIARLGQPLTHAGSPQEFFKQSSHLVITPSSSGATAP